MKRLNKGKGGGFVVPVEEQRTTLFSAESPFRCSSTGASNSALTPVVSVEDYRKIMGDSTSSPEQISERVQYLEMLFRSIISSELKTNHDNTKEIAPKERE